MAETNDPKEAENPSQAFPPAGASRVNSGRSRAPVGDEPDEIRNLAPDLTAEELKKLADSVIKGHVDDVSSRSSRMKRARKWQRFYASDMEAKNWPFQNAANVNAPLLAYAHQQIHGRLWDMLIPASGDLCHAKATTLGAVDRALAAEQYFNAFLRHDLPYYALGWYATISGVCRGGSSFRRQYYDPVTKRICVDWLGMEDVVVAYTEKNMDPSMRGVRRYTIVLRMDDQRLQKYLDEKTFEVPKGGKPLDAKTANNADEKKSEFAKGADRIDGVEPNAGEDGGDKPRMILEQYRWWKFPKRKGTPGFDGKYHAVIVWVDEPTKQVLRMVRREEDDPRDKRRYERELQAQEMQLQAVAMAQEAYAGALQEALAIGAPPPPAPPAPEDLPEPTPAQKREISFMTHVRGFDSDGYYGIGLGDLLGPLNEAMNTILNQMIDAMTIKNAGGGWYSSQMRMPTGAVSFTPGEYQRIEAPAGIMKDGIIHRTSPEVSAVTMPMVQFLKEFGQQLTSTGEVMSGDSGGANKTATEVQVTAEMAMKQISVLARIIIEAMKCELENLWRLLSLFLDEDEAARFAPDGYHLTKDDFVSDIEVTPSADPRVSSNAELVGKAHALLGGVSQNPLTQGNRPIMMLATERWLTAMGERGMAQMLGPAQPPPPPPKPQWEENAGFLMEQDSAVHPQDDDDTHLDEMGLFHADPQGGQALSPQGSKMYDRHARAHMAQRLMKMRAGEVGHERPPQPGGMAESMLQMQGGQNGAQQAQ